MCYIKFSPIKIFSWEPTAFSEWLSIKNDQGIGDVKFILSIWFFSRYGVVFTKYREFTGLNYRWLFKNAIFHDFNVQKFHIGISASTYSPLNKIDECVQSVRSWRDIDSFMLQIVQYKSDSTNRTVYRIVWIVQYTSYSMNRTVRIKQYASFSTNRTVRIVQYESYNSTIHLVKSISGDIDNDRKYSVF